MSRFVIAAFRPRAGMQQALEIVVAKHWSVLRAENLVTDKPRHVMRSTDGTIIEVFEWRSPQAIEAAHRNPVVQALWAEFDTACEYVPLAALPESQRLFSEFEALTL